MANPPRKLPINLPLPSTILRVSAVTFLVSAFVFGLASRGAVGVSRELSGFFILPMFLFLLFFLEYKIAETIAKVSLNALVGYVQAFGCLAIVVYGILQILSSKIMGAPSAAVSEYTFLVLAIFGELVFLCNVVLSYVESNRLQPRRAAGLQPVLKPNQQPPADKPATTTWPRSPVRSFTISAVFFLGLGFIFQFARPFAVQLPIHWHGHLSRVPLAYLWMFAAVPFAAFALTYWGIELFTGWKFDLSATRIHLVCTLLVVVEATRVYSSWAMSLPFEQSIDNAVTAKAFTGVFAFGVLTVAAFAWNLWTSRLQTLQKGKVR